ncbi:hypothetical protein ANO11243_062380 [Dothideomycetidae sp. 11243]|nr:hypothetical protein ANO11243_062380 [fungal sp. No.11243]
MLLSFVALTGAIAGLVSGAAIPETHAIHEKRSDLPAHARRWVKRDRAHASATLPVRIGLKQKNIEQGHDWLMSVSHPESENFGKFWSSEDVVKAFQPSDETVQAVRDWLVSIGGIEDSRLTHSDNKGWLAFDATTEEVESLLHTTYHTYEHTNSGSMFVGTDEYHVPKSIQAHIDYITPGIKGVKIAGTGLQKRRIDPSRSTKPLSRDADFIPSDPDSLDTCDVAVTPACIRALYGFDAPNPWDEVCESNAMGIFEEGDFYSQEDLNEFFTNFTRGDWNIPNGTHPTLNSVDGGFAPVPVAQAGGESDLDFELAYPIVYPQNITLYQTDDGFYTNPASNITGNYTGAGFLNTFLDAIDGSYCTKCDFGECGNDPINDPTYPDNNPGGYNGPLQCGVFKPTNVISVSYGEQEADLPAYYMQRQCNEFLKLGLQGVSIFFASGDDGVAGPAGDQSPNGCLNNGTVFSPADPNSCPWLTNVGATKIYPGNGPFDPESAANDPKGHPYHSAFASGGGFSNIYPIPDYQKDAVATYFSEHDPAYPYYSGSSFGNGLYNRTGRGYPDVAANGDNIATYTNGKYELHGGTSASTPIVASLFNRVIEERIRIGKGPIGFVNPVLYSNPWVMNDITNGSNPGCGTNGFDAVEGWDPVSGLGTPNYPLILDLYLGLP